MISPHTIQSKDYERTVEALSKTRRYKPTARYPGITKILTETKDSSGLDEWRKRVGEEEADRIVNESTAIGRSLDDIAMKFFRCDFNEAEHRNELGYPLFSQIKPTLSKITPVGTQFRLWSDRLKVKGFPDIIGWYNNELSIIDVKNTRKTKRREYIADYFHQCTAYSLMLYEMTGVQAKQIVVLIGDRSTVSPQIFIERVSHHAAKTIGRINSYHESQIQEQSDSIQ